jgi:plasmid maintenance system killer protein
MKLNSYDKTKKLVKELQDKFNRELGVLLNNCDEPLIIVIVTPLNNHESHIGNSKNQISISIN